MDNAPFIQSDPLLPKTLSSPSTSKKIVTSWKFAWGTFRRLQSSWLQFWKSQNSRYNWILIFAVWAPTTQFRCLFWLSTFFNFRRPEWSHLRSSWLQEITWFVYHRHHHHHHPNARPWSSCKHFNLFNVNKNLTVIKLLGAPLSFMAVGHR